MKKLTLSFWLAAAAAGIFTLQLVSPMFSQHHLDDPIPTCPPECPPSKPKPPTGQVQ